VSGERPDAEHLRRATPPPPTRIVHLGLGAFSRSHTAWYTGAARDATEWGISAYTGRSRALADALTAQDGLYTLVERDEEADRAEVITSVVTARPGTDVVSLCADLAAPATALVTLTITEAGYRLGADDLPDRNDAVVRADGELLSALPSGQISHHPGSVLGRLLLGLDLRRRAGGGSITLLSCDNVPDNGGRLGRGLLAWADELSPMLADWIREHVSFASSSVDRITPRIADQEAASLATRYGDAAPVVAEPFHDWIISGRFPAGRPEWESAGARFVDDLEPWEARKLWLLNGAHTLLATLGRLRGHTTVSEAIADPACRAQVEMLWDDAARQLPPGLDLVAYRSALIRRFENPRIVHSLTQIATDNELKLRLRVVPVAERERAAGRMPEGSAAAIAAWIAAGERGLLPRGDFGRRSVAEHIAALSPRLAADPPFVAAVERLTAGERVFA
jgi:fructuronate reductase